MPPQHRGAEPGILPLLDEDEGDIYGGLAGWSQVWDKDGKYAVKTPHEAVAAAGADANLQERMI